MENLKGILLGICLLMFIAVPTESADNETFRKRVQLALNSWPSQVLYDTEIACYQGTVKWIMLANPTLIGQQPPPAVQRLMLEHCFCIMDLIRLEYPFPDYVIALQTENPGAIFMQKSYQCIREYDTLPGIAIVEDNSTKSDNSTTMPEGNIPSESPDQKQKEQIPLSKPNIFQG